MDKGSRKPLTVQEQLDMDLMAAAELERLQRQYRIMEGDRKAFTEETSKKLGKQKMTIKVLKKEKGNIMNDLAVATSDLNKRKDREMNKYVMKLMEVNDQYAKEIKEEKSHLSELNHQIKKIEKDVEVLRTQQITDAQCQEKVITGHKTLDALENKLETAIKKFCGVLTENKKLREEIDLLLKERVNFNKLWDKLIISLATGKKFMIDLVEQASLAYDQREEWCAKLQALRMRGFNDILLHDEEMRELQRKLDHDGKLKEFLNVKAQRRVMKDLEEKEAKKRELIIEEMEKQLRVYQETLAQIREFSGEEDVERLAAQYVKQEEENFALFNYVNELNHELEILSDSIGGLRINIAEQKELNERRSAQQRDTVESLTQILENEQQKTAFAIEEMKQAETNLQNILAGINDIFNIIKCNNAPILELLGQHTEVDAHNVMLYLGLIDKKVTDMIINVYYKEKANKCKRDLFDLYPKKSSNCNLDIPVPSTPCASCVQGWLNDITVTKVLNKEEAILEIAGVRFLL